MTTYYQILGVKEGASEKEIASAYRHLAKKYHPDVEGGDAGVFREISESYRILSDPSLRREYDLKLRPAGNLSQANPLSSFVKDNMYAAAAATLTVYLGLFMIVAATTFKPWVIFLPLLLGLFIMAALFALKTKK
jgi:curved DNA-binding protein CbpA